MDLTIRMFWDNEAAVWVATSEDVPGLALESGSFDALVERVKIATPEIMELNHRKAPIYNLNFVSERRVTVAAYG